MNTFRRIQTYITTNWDGIICRLENHEAQLNASISEIQRSYATSKTTFKRVETDGERLKKSLAEKQNLARQWQERAVIVAPNDRNKALECLRRKKHLDIEIADLNAQISDHDSSIKKLRADIQRIRDHLDELIRSRNLLRTREHRALAMNTISQCSPDQSASIIERWDARITFNEVASQDITHEIDSLDQEFSLEEESSQLNAELDLLLCNSTRE
jgi:phage shock protein A